jgi:CheY-like chemotaxis protein
MGCLPDILADKVLRAVPASIDFTSIAFARHRDIISAMPATPTAASRILLVDDDPLVCDSIRRMLEFDQYKVQAVATAREALALCEKENFDLVILDYLMPVMKGDKLAIAIKQQFPNLPIIMITADAEKVESTEDRPEGVDFLMGKPFQLTELREAVSKMLRKP